MSRESQIVQLFDTADLGRQCEDLLKNPAMIALIKRLEEKSQDATERMVCLNPFTEQAEIAAEQLVIRIYKGIKQEINAFINEGRHAGERLEATEKGED